MIWDHSPRLLDDLAEVIQLVSTGSSIAPGKACLCDRPDENRLRRGDGLLVELVAGESGGVGRLSLWSGRYAEVSRRIDRATL